MFQSFNLATIFREGLGNLKLCALKPSSSKEPFMPKDLTWEDAEDIGLLLSEKHTTLDPLAVRFTDLHRYVTELPEFKDDPQKSSEAKLEAIQMAWHDEFLDRTQG
jgi:FeS assembly protein IscX